MAKDKLRVANIIEEGKLRAHLRIAHKSIKEKVDMTVIMPSENSDDFRLCEHREFLSFSISRLTKDWAVAFRYLLSIEIIEITKFLRKGNFDLICQRR